MVLYKYFGQERIDVIKNQMIRFSQPSAFNDPFEFKPALSTVVSRDEFRDVFESELDEQIEIERQALPVELRNMISNDMLKVLVREQFLLHEDRIAANFIKGTNQVSGVITAKYNELVGVLCLTENCDNLLMWSHYGESHAGFCLGFDTSAKFFNRKRSENDDLYHLRKVKYLSNRPNKTISTLNGIDVYLSKSDIWSYEQEWRMAAVLQDSECCIETGETPIHLFKFPASALVEIVFGANATTVFIDSVLDILKVAKLSHITLKKTVIAEREYALEFIDL